MLTACVLFAGVVTGFTPPQPWALNFAAPPRLPFVGDVNADGLADLIVVYPPGDAIIDVSLSVDGAKAGRGFQALPRWGRYCLAATVGDFDGKPGCDVVGLFDQTLQLAGDFRQGRLQNDANWVRLPERLKEPQLTSFAGGVIAYSSATGLAFRVEATTRKVTRLQLPRRLVWLGELGPNRWVAQDRSGKVMELDAAWKPTANLGQDRPGSRPALRPGLLAFGDRILLGSTKIPVLNSTPEDDIVRHFGDVDGDGDQDLVEFHYGKQPHLAFSVTLRRAITEGELDADHDGLNSERERELGTDPLNPDTDNDGLLDGWEVNGFRGLDLPGLGCNPRRTDVVCLVSPFEGVQPETLKAGLDRATRFYRELNTPNPDGSRGFQFHPMVLAPVTGEATRRHWAVNRDAFLPAKWRGVVHWMQVTPGGGGQADQLGDGGSCGVGALWAVFVHEFGHQLGLGHEGFWSNGWSPTYTSLMSYNYSYGLEDDIEKIRYSDGALVNYVLRESDLDETLPLPYEKVRFLEKGPYRFRLKPNGSTTLIDWNWNGVFGEKHVRADVNYAYSTHAGRRDDVGKSHTSPSLFVHRGRAHVLYGTTDAPANPKQDPTLSATRPGRLMMRTLVKPFQWEAPQVLAEGLTGDPAGISHQGKLVLAYPVQGGVMVQVGDKKSKLGTPAPAEVSLASHRGQLLLSVWDAATGLITLHRVGPDGATTPLGSLEAKSTNPPGMVTDTKSGELVVATAENQDARRPHRWQVRRFRMQGDKFLETGSEWVEGPDGQARGTGRLTVLFDPSRDSGRSGSLYVFGRGMTTPESPWACTYVAHQIGDATVRGGWLVRRYYDEWTQSRSAPAAAWFGKDVIWSYRWVDGAQGPTDNNLHVGYGGLGIQSEPMGDHDDLTFLRTFGVRHSILNLASP